MPAAVHGQGPGQGSAALHGGQAELAGLRADSWHQELGEEANTKGSVIGQVSFQQIL